MLIKNPEWKTVPYLRKGESRDYDYTLILNEPLASWDVWDYWERERVESMRQNLTKEDVLFDIGAEMGWLSVIYAKMVGPSNLVLIEPTKEFWPNIRATWQRNLDGIPMAVLCALLSDKTTTGFEPKIYPIDGWPNEAYGQLIDKSKYQYIHDNSDDVPEIKIDELINQTGIVPTALTMDTEGSELLILKGAENLLRNNKTKVWVSVHPDLGKRDYGVEPDEVEKYMKSLGYVGQFLAEDHERHYYFRKAK